MCLIIECYLRLAENVKKYMAHVPCFLHKIRKCLKFKRLNHKGFRKKENVLWPYGLIVRTVPRQTRQVGSDHRKYYIWADRQGNHSWGWLTWRPGLSRGQAGNDKQWGEVTCGQGSLSLSVVCELASQGSNKSRIVVTLSCWLGFICTLGANQEAEAMFSVLEMEVKGGRRREWAVAVTQPEAY